MFEFNSEFANKSFKCLTVHIIIYIFRGKVVKNYSPRIVRKIFKDYHYQQKLLKNH